MSQTVSEFTDLLLRQGVVSLDQLSEAEKLAEERGIDVGDSLIDLEYATPEEVAEAMAKFHKVPYVDLRSTQIPEDVIELVPESVARENTVIPYSASDGSLRVLLSDPFDLETVEKLRFILNQKIETALAPKSAITAAINKYYGQVEGESADSMLQEFTDTAIDFTETDGGMSDGDGRRRRLMIDSTPPSSASWQSDDRKRPCSFGQVIFTLNLSRSASEIRYRIDGVLRGSREAAPRRMLAAIIARIKILAKDRHQRKNDALLMGGSKSPSVTSSSICGSASSLPTTANPV